MPKPTGFTAYGKIEGWLRKNRRKNFNYSLRYTRFTSKQVGELLGISKTSAYRALIILETRNQVKRYDRLKEGIVWENILIDENLIINIYDNDRIILEAASIKLYRYCRRKKIKMEELGYSHHLEEMVNDLSKVYPKIPNTWIIKIPITDYQRELIHSLDTIDKAIEIAKKLSA